MIIITDKTLVIPVGIAPNYAGAGNADVKLQSKSVTITENGSKTLFPDSNYTGFSQVNITTNVVNNPVLEDKNVEIIENGDYSFIPGPTYDGIGNFRLKVNVETHEPIQVQPVKTAYPSFENDVTVVPSEGYEAMSSVIVKKAEPNLQDKAVDKASTSEIVLRADAGYQGLGTVTVAPIKTKTVSADPSTNVQEFSANTEVNEYITNVTVNPVGTKTVTVDSSINAQTINANVEGNEYITSVTVNPVKTKSLSITPRLVEQTFTAEQELYKTVNVSAIKHTEKTYDASTNTQTYDYAENNDVFIKNLTINPVTSSIDPNIVPENIAKGVSILGVNGTLEQSSSDTTNLIKSTGAPYSAKLKVYQVYLEDKNDSLYEADVPYGETPSDLRSGDAGTSGYIPFFIKNFRKDYIFNPSILGTLEERGIIAVVVNGVIYENPTSFNIPYTKVNDGSTNYDDVTVDVYIDFEKANARAEFIENGNITGTDANFDVNTYKYLPPIFNENIGEYFYINSNITIFETVETYIRQPINALSKYFLTPCYDNTDCNIGNITFLLGEDGIKRVPDKPGTFEIAKFNNITFYGSVNNYKTIQNWFYDYDYNTVVYGNVNGFDQTKQLPESSKSTTFFGNVSTPIGYYDEYRAQFMGVDSSVCDFGENITANDFEWKGKEIRADVVIMPSTLEKLYANKGTPSSFKWYFEAKTYVFFGKTPPTMPSIFGASQQRLRKGSYKGEYNPLTTIYIPAGADYSSILYDVSNVDPQYHDKLLPTIIEFTPVSSTSEINGPGIYGLTDYRGYHSLIEIKPSTLAEQDLQTVATEINNL